MDDVRSMFLGQSLMDCEEAFADAVARRDAQSWDWLVVTAASEAQAATYRAQIDQRMAAGQLPRQTRYLVIADPGGKRVGSGGATLNVLREIAQRNGGPAPFAGQRILVLHSGGDSQRIPQYSACGKLFSRVPRALRDGRPSTLFDEFCISLSCVPPRMHGGMLVMSGDVLLLFNALQIDLERLGAACLTIKAPVETGTHHGVFVGDGDGHVASFLHKQPTDVLRVGGAVNAQGMVDIDTGSIWLDEERIAALYGLIAGSDEAFDRFVNEAVRLSFYGDFVYPMSADATLDSFLKESAENVQSEALAACRRAIWDVLGTTRMSMIRLAPAEFIHFGTTREWRDLLLQGEERFGFLGWQRDVMSVGAGEGFAAINSVIEPGARIGAGCAIEDCRIGAAAVIGEGCVVSGADFDDTLPPDTCLHVLPVDGGEAYCARIYGVNDNPKMAERLGEPTDGPLWSAPLHPVAPTMRAAIDTAISGGTTGRTLSLRDSFAQASLPDILERQQALTDGVRARRVMDAVAGGTCVQDVLGLLTRGEAGRRQIETIRASAQTAPFPLRHRLYYTLARAVEDSDPQQALSYDDACWYAINEHLLGNAKASLDEMPPPRIVLDKAEVSLPVRTNWGGAWSDTPPYCLEHGGTVLNISLLLDGGRPVHGAARRLEEPIIRIESDDLGVTRDYTTLESLSTGNPHDPHALCKAALVVCGVIPDGAQGPLRPLLEKLGGGICLRTAVRNVPKGSGLGTSSIVGAAVVRALCQLLGQPDDDVRVSSLVLCMEQLMNTGGGWQDQIGGLVPGIKLTSSPPGTPQRLTWRHIDMSDEAFAELSDRYTLIYTGQRRLARNILREIMGKVVANDPQTMQILAQIQRLGVLMAFELETGDIDAFARMLAEHWALSKRLDAGSTNTCIDHMLGVIEDQIDGMMICGAGGGGFLGVVRKRGVPEAALAERLADVFQESGVKVWNASIER